MSASQVFVRKGKGELIEDTQSDEMEAGYGLEVEECVEDERWEIGAKVCGVVDCVAGKLL